MRAHKPSRNRRPAKIHPSAKKSLRSRSLAAARWLATILIGLWLLAALLLTSLRWCNPPTTAVRVERHLEGWFAPHPYTERYAYVPLSQISPQLQHAVIAAEDARFYQHHGFDWHAMELAAQNDLDGGRRLRGGSTLTQQLVKNIYFGTGRSILRKIAEASLVPVAELMLGKRRILELYLNEVEWGPGIFGAQAASRYYDHTQASRLSRDEAARLAAILPDPRHRKPQQMNHYSALIERRMSQMGW